MRFKFNIPSNKPFDAVGFGLNAVDYVIVVPHYPQFTSKVRIVEQSLHPGGQIATAMVALARLGCRVSYIGKVGSDHLGQIQLASLAAEGVFAEGVTQVEGATNQFAYILIDQPSGERTVLWGRDEKLAFRPEELSRERITAGRILHLDACDTQAAIEAARWARESGIPVVVDLDTVYPGIEEFLPLVDFMVSSANFPGQLTGIEDRREALRAMKDRYGCYFVAMTIGEQGVLAYHENEYIHLPAFHVDCHDTTGAGDAFHGGFIYGLLHGMGVEETLRFANAVAGLKCTKIGARTGLPSISEVEKLLSSQMLRRPSPS